MSVEALWIVDPVIPPSVRAELERRHAARGAALDKLVRSVVVLEAGRLVGGDAGSTWIGAFDESEAQTVKIRVTITFHDDDCASLLDPQSRRHDVVGLLELRHDGRSMRGRIRLVDDPTRFQDVELRRVAELPRSA